MKIWLVWFCSSLLLFPALLVAAEIKELRLPKPRTMEGSAYVYFTGLIQKALEKGANGRPVPRLVATIEMSEDRMVRELRAGRTIDIFWLGGSRHRGQGLLLVPVPLERGLVGYRQFIIRKERVADFDAVESLADLAKFTACQGAQWGDSAILRDANLALVTSVNFESLFKQLVAGRCDYFPRGIHQGKGEMASRSARYPDLMVYEPLILHYPHASYLYLHPSNKALAQWLQDGLEKMIDDGELFAYMREQEHTRRAFPLHDQRNTRFLMIPNHDLPEFSDEQNPRYWFLPSDFLAVPDTESDN
jgi:hypothetical protein